MSDLFYKDENGEYKPAQKESLMMTVVKLNKEREDLVAKVEANNTLMESRFSMFEQLLRERLDFTCHEVDDIKRQQEESNKALKKAVENYAGILVERQRVINRDVEDRFTKHEGVYKEIKADIVLLDGRMQHLETKDVKAKALLVDKVVYGVGGLVLALFLTNLEKIFTVIVRLFGG